MAVLLRQDNAGVEKQHKMTLSIEPTDKHHNWRVPLALDRKVAAEVMRRDRVDPLVCSNGWLAGAEKALRYDTLIQRHARAHSLKCYHNDDDDDTTTTTTTTTTIEKRHRARRS